MTDLFELVSASTPLLIDVPHAGTYLPEWLIPRLTSAARALPDTDWHVDKLYRFARATGAGLMVATHSRYVIDLNRDPRGIALYPGADNTELCPLRTFADQPIYLPGAHPDDAEVARRIAQYFTPYHARLQAELAALRQRFEYVILLDGHSILSRVPRLFAGRLPDLNFGTADGQSCDPGLAQVAWAVLSGAPGLSSVHNGRFKGGYITRHYGRPREGVHALQLEMAQASYLDEACAATFDEARAQPLIQVLAALVDELLAWQPQRSAQPTAHSLALPDAWQRGKVAGLGD